MNAFWNFDILLSRKVYPKLQKGSVRKKEIKMKTIDVKVCACTACVMNGSMSLANSIEELNRVKSHLGIDAEINVEMCKCIGEHGHNETAPVASVNEEIITKAKSEIVMEKITELAK